jgi:hypothetical protein
MVVAVINVPSAGAYHGFVAILSKHAVGIESIP